MLACKGIAGPTTYLLVANVVNVFKASTAVDLILDCCTHSIPEMVSTIMMVVTLMASVAMIPMMILSHFLGTSSNSCISLFVALSCVSHVVVICGVG